MRIILGFWNFVFCGVLCLVFGSSKGFWLFLKVLLFSFVFRGIVDLEVFWFEFI